MLGGPGTRKTAHQDIFHGSENRSNDFHNFCTRQTPRDALQVGMFTLAVKNQVVAMETAEVAKVSHFERF